MPSPFPGMDPYLEQPVYWSEFHSRLIVAIADALTPCLLPRYYVGVETRTYRDFGDDSLLVGIPDAVVLSAKGSPETPLPKEDTETIGSTVVQVRPQKVTLPISANFKERYLEVREMGTDAVITVVEILSPKNKRKGEGRTAYEIKRQAILDSTSHLVEIDLLRRGIPMAMQGADGKSDYRVLVSRSEVRPHADLYRFTTQEAIPSFHLPLKGVTESIAVDLQEIVSGVYERGGYELRIDYQSKTLGMS